MNETGYGIGLDPYKCTKEELVKAIDELIYDHDLKEKLKKASERILSEDKHSQLAELIEQLCYF